MGVMSCSKGDCNSIMCYCYVNGIGYVCSECQEEFKKYIQAKGIIITGEGDMKHHLKHFMENEDKGRYNNNISTAFDIDNYFSECSQ